MTRSQTLEQALWLLTQRLPTPAARRVHPTLALAAVLVRAVYVIRIVRTPRISA